MSSNIYSSLVSSLINKIRFPSIQISRISLLKIFVCTSIGIGLSLSSSSVGSGISASSGLTEIFDGDDDNVNNIIDKPSGCNLNEPWLCSEYMYYESHTCTLNNVCIFNEYAFLHSGEFQTKMTHHCQKLPFNCQYFHQIKQCRTRYCSTTSLCNVDKDGYELCLIKALLCYDEYCEPDLAQLPFDYRLYDLCCHINDIGMYSPSCTIPTTILYYNNNK